MFYSALSVGKFIRRTNQCTNIGISVLTTTMHIVGIRVSISPENLLQTWHAPDAFGSLYVHLEELQKNTKI